MPVQSLPTLRVRKDTGIFLEPIKEGYSGRWEGHHATNPCAIRFSCDPRVFLGYRAGGDDDIYYVWHYKVWGSHLGLAILNESGEKIDCRLPLPIYRLEHNVPMPKSEKEFYEVYQKGPHTKEIVVLHDFRFFEYRDFLYLVYHEGPLEECYDCVVRMPVREFLSKIDHSIQLSAKPVEDIMQEWRSTWWAKGVWEPCGLNGGNRIFASKVVKGDNIYFELEDGTLQMCHRPLAFGMATVNTGDKFYLEPTPDGVTKYGCFETNTRPGMMDNSHIGANGAPARARIGEKEVYIDVTHGCWRDLAASKGDKAAPDIMYYAYFRVKDRKTGELLYYSDVPVIDYGKDWNRQAISGEWISINTALAGVMFAGGQVEKIPGKNGLDDEFITYVGLGDTAIGLGRFTIREMLPERVIAQIQTREADLAKPVADIPSAKYEHPEKVHGWKWGIRNNPKKRVLEVVRELEKTGESSVREINSRPGYFDPHGLGFGDSAIRFDKDLECIVIAYQGLCLEENHGAAKTCVGRGLLLLSARNPEQVLYRSALPVMFENLDGWRFSKAPCSQQILDRYREFLPSKVLAEIQILNELRKDDLPFASQMEIWLRQKSGLEPVKE